MCQATVRAEEWEEATSQLKRMSALKRPGQLRVTDGFSEGRGLSTQLPLNYTEMQTSKLLQLHGTQRMFAPMISGGLESSFIDVDVADSSPVHASLTSW